jgi:hypothetical protein
VTTSTPQTNISKLQQLSNYQLPISNSVPGNKQPKYGGIKCGGHVNEKHQESGVISVFGNDE